MNTKYIISLLSSSSRVIIPKLGAFLVKNQGQSSSYAFNSILKFEDSLLCDFIAQEKKISKADAAKEIEDFASEIMSVISTGEQYKLEGMGSLYKDANGKIQFIESKLTTAATPQKTKEEKLSVEKTFIIEIENTPVTTENKKSTTDTKPSQETESSSSDKKVFKNNKNMEAKKNNSFLLIIVVVLIIAVGLSLYLLLSDKISADDSLTQKSGVSDSLKILEEQFEQETEANINDLIPEDLDAETSTQESTEAPTADQNTTKPVSKPSAVVNSEPKYYIVAGCFKNESNADNFVKKLRSEGYEAEKFGIIKDLHAVSYSMHNNMDDAIEALRKIKSTREANAWLIKY